VTRFRIWLFVGLLAVVAATLGATATASPPNHYDRAVCAAAAPGHARCFAHVVTNGAGKPIVSASPTAVSAYGPVQFQTAYGLTAAAAAPTNEVIAIVDAFDDPNAKANLDTYSVNYGLPVLPMCSGPSGAGCFRKVNQTGASSPLPTADTGWGLEISLDLDTAHAVCPNCGILLVEANSNGDSDLYAAEDYAASQSSIVSNSWGGGEYGGETTDDAHFNHPGVAITVSSGDGGYGVEYPAASRYVTAVGGTTLTLNANNTRNSETVWSGAGSGCSVLEAKPSWQKDSGCSRRTVADVSADADPNTGAAVYDTYGYGGWLQVGGTSLASPLIASVYALAGVGGTSDYPASYPYAHTASLFDVVSGLNGFCFPIYLCRAGTGYDGPSGLGTPIGTAAFAPSGPPPPPPTVTQFSPTSGSVGDQIDVQGTNLTGATKVTFNGTSDTSFVVKSSIDITAHVPAGASTGRIAVTTPGGTGTSSTDFTVSGGGGSAPTVTSFVPTTGPVGTSVTINGTNFTGVTSVQFNGTPAIGYSVNSSVMITASVPTGAATGFISVTNGSGTGTSSTLFTVTTAGAPKITSFSPTYGRTGAVVVINGSNLTGATSVQLGTTSASFTVNSAAKITATVPSMAPGSYRWQVTTPGGTAASPLNFFHF
jgi:subtilase family serine protease